MIDDMSDTIQIIPIPAFQDNYIWLIHNGVQAIVIDPGDAVPVLGALETHHLQLQTILITHYHQDHIGGVGKLLASYPDLKAFAPKHEPYDFKHTPIAEPDKVPLGSWLSHAEVIDLPGHTLGHVAYYIVHNSQRWLFCGDTLFGAGCGRLFEGSPKQMLSSLKKLARLPDDTKVFCAHEYTLNNIDFALSLDPHNPALKQRKQETISIRAAQLPSLPSTIALELATNPFLRSGNPAIQASMQLSNASELDVFTKIRELKNIY